MGHANLSLASHPSVRFPKRALLNAPPCPLPKLPYWDQIPPPKQLKMTWAIFDVGSHCNSPLSWQLPIPLQTIAPQPLICHPEPLTGQEGF